MNTKERDDLLIRLDKLTKNIWREFDDRDDNIKAYVKEIKQHQLAQNGQIKDLFYSTTKNTIWRKVIIGVGGSALLAIIGVMLKMAGVY